VEATNEVVWLDRQATLGCVRLTEEDDEKLGSIRDPRKRALGFCLFRKRLEGKRNPVSSVGGQRLNLLAATKKVSWREQRPEVSRC
jgi:hypothetical protein